MQFAVIGKPAYLAEWTWSHKLPHATATLSWQKSGVASTGETPAAKVMTELEAELRRREQTVEAQKLMQADKQGGRQPLLPCIVIIFDYLSPDYTHPALSLLMEKGSELNVYGIFLTDKQVYSQRMRQR